MDENRSMPRSTTPFETVRWSPEGVVLLDQRRLPGEEVYLTLSSVEEIAAAIEDLVVRGAPAIGCTAALGIAWAAAQSDSDEIPALLADLEAAFTRLGATRPTAYNLFEALGRMRERLEAELAGASPTVDRVRDALLEQAIHVVEEDAELCRRIGEAGLPLIAPGSRILTHCNAGALATAGIGTALGVVRAAHEAGREPRVLAGETRPFFQGARLTAWELDKVGVPVSVHTDGMVGHLMQRGEIDLVIVGADRITANGDVANKVGTYGIAVLAHEHGVPFYVAAPFSTIDLATATGSEIEIEERGRDEVAIVSGVPVVPDGVPVRYPAFDVTPSRLVTAIITDRGIVRPPFAESLRRVSEGASRAPLATRRARSGAHVAPV